MHNKCFLHSKINYFHSLKQLNKTTIYLYSFRLSTYKISYLLPISSMVIPLSHVTPHHIKVILTEIRWTTSDKLDYLHRFGCTFGLKSDIFYLFFERIGFIIYSLFLVLLFVIYIYL